MKPLRTRRAVIKDWVNELSARSKRPIEDILKRGLSLYDFPKGNSSVVVHYYPDLKMVFENAFVIIRPTTKEACVITEHMGYREFDLEDGMTIEEVSRNYYIYEEPEDEDNLDAENN